MKHYKRLTYPDRIRIEVLYNHNVPISAIASELGRSRQSIYFEIQKGKYLHRNTDWTESVKYSAYKAQARTDFNRTTQRPPLKIQNDYIFVKEIEAAVKRKNSPAVALHSLKNASTRVCVSTLYSYIDKGIFLHITNKNLPRKCKKRKKRAVRYVKSSPIGRSIEKRPQSINDRSEFGHWEMDTVIGKAKKGDCLLVLTERQTNYQLIRRIPAKNAASVVHAIDEIQCQNSFFSSIFRSITIDNGCEFRDTKGIERNDRTVTYYCHPYSSWERGQNENQNAMIRRFIIKGTPIEHYSDDQIREVQDWLNNMPRKLYDWHTSKQQFENALSKIGISPDKIFL